MTVSRKPLAPPIPGPSDEVVDDIDNMARATPNAVLNLYPSHENIWMLFNKEMPSASEQRGVIAMVML